MQVGSLVAARTAADTNRSDRATVVDTLTILQWRLFQEVSAERTVASRRSEDKIELMRTCSVGTSDCNDNAVTDNPYHGAPCGDTDTEVASLSSSRQAALLSVCAHRVPVPLGEEFCLQSRRSASGRLQGHASCLLLGDAQNNAEETRLARMATLSNTCFLIGHTRSTLLGTSTIH